MRQVSLNLKSVLKFLVQAINISGGINPNRVSDIKKNEKTPGLEKTFVIDSKIINIKNIVVN